MNFAQRLTKIMEEKKLTSYKVSKDTGISDSLIGYYRTGKNDPSSDNLVKLSRYFRVTTDYLLGLSDTSAFSEMDEIAFKTARLATLHELRHSNEFKDEVSELSKEKIKMIQDYAKSVIFTEEETLIVQAYRKNPELQKAVQRVLGVDVEEKDEKEFVSGTGFKGKLIAKDFGYFESEEEPEEPRIL